MLPMKMLLLGVLESVLLHILLNIATLVKISIFHVINNNKVIDPINIILKCIFFVLNTQVFMSCSDATTSGRKIGLIQKIDS